MMSSFPEVTKRLGLLKKRWKVMRKMEKWDGEITIVGQRNPFVNSKNLSLHSEGDCAGECNVSEGDDDSLIAEDLRCVVCVCACAHVSAFVGVFVCMWMFACVCVMTQSTHLIIIYIARQTSSGLPHSLISP